MKHTNKEDRHVAKAWIQTLAETNGLLTASKQVVRPLRGTKTYDRYGDNLYFVRQMTEKVVIASLLTPVTEDAALAQDWFVVYGGTLYANLGEEYSFLFIQNTKVDFATLLYEG